MSHDIDYSTGDPAIAYVGETPWHGLGECLQEGQSIEVWLKAAKLEWNLKRLPVQFLVDSALRTMDDRYVLVRDDTEQALSVVSGDYQIVQPKEVVEFYRDLVDLYGYTLETAGALNGGRKVWALAKTGITGSADEGGKDPLNAYILLATSCDKSLATTAAFTSVRVVCQNTLTFAMDDVNSHGRRHLKIPHTRRFDSQSVKSDLGLIDKAWESFITKVRNMTAYAMDKPAASAFFEDLLCKKKDDEKLSPKAQREHETLMALYGSAPGQELITAKNTLWGAVNTATYYVDHVRNSGAGDRLDSSWFGPGAVLKDKTWSAAANLLDKAGAK